MRSPEPWHADAVRAAYHSGEEAWALTAVFGMRFLPGFEEQIVEALESENQEIHSNAVQAAGAVVAAPFAAYDWAQDQRGGFDGFLDATRKENEERAQQAAAQQAAAPADETEDKA